MWVLAIEAALRALPISPGQSFWVSSGAWIGKIIGGEGIKAEKEQKQAIVRLLAKEKGGSNRKGDARQKKIRERRKKKGRRKMEDEGV